MGIVTKVEIIFLTTKKIYDSRVRIVTGIWMVHLTRLQLFSNWFFEFINSVAIRLVNI